MEEKHDVAGAAQPAQPAPVELVRRYTESLNGIARLSGERDAVRKDCEEKKYNISARYRDLIRDLERKQREEEDAVDASLKAVEEQKNGEIEVLSKEVARIKKLVTFLEMAESFQPVQDIIESDVKQYERHGENRHLEWLDYIHHDDFLKVRLLIAGNKKPTNKYTLTAYGRCLFAEGKLVEDMRYGSRLSLDDWRGERQGFAVRVDLGSWSSVADVNKWVARRKKDILKDYIAKVLLLEEEYRTAAANYRLSDFDAIRETGSAKSLSEKP